MTILAGWFITEIRLVDQPLSTSADLLAHYQVDILPGLSVANIRELLRAAMPLPQLSPAQATQLVIQHLGELPAPKGDGLPGPISLLGLCPPRRNFWQPLLYRSRYLGLRFRLYRAECHSQHTPTLLPAELQFLISDNGPQFKAETSAQLAGSANFIHIRIAPRRACTNGIAERFVQTLKAWLAQHSWTNQEELVDLLTEFLAFYNDRPHQGAGLNNLSPNEYTRRLISYSTC